MAAKNIPTPQPTPSNPQSSPTNPVQGMANPSSAPTNTPASAIPPSASPGTFPGVPGNNAYDSAQGAANRIYQNVGTDTGNVIANTQGLQNQAVNEAAQTYNTAEPGYAEFARTGGFSPSDETTFLNRATQGVSDTYKVLGEQAERQRMAAGGLGTGGEISQMARQGTQAQARALEGAQVDLKTMENTNKLAGLAGTTSLFNTTTGQVTEMGRQILGALGIRYGTQAEAAKILASLTSKDVQTGLQRSLGEIGQIAGMAGGAIGAIP